jgi:hypothetical protein
MIVSTWLRSLARVAGRRSIRSRSVRRRLELEDLEHRHLPSVTWQPLVLLEHAAASVTTDADRAKLSPRHHVPRVPIHHPPTRPPRHPGVTNPTHPVVAPLQPVVAPPPAAVTPQPAPFTDQQLQGKWEYSTTLQAVTGGPAPAVLDIVFTSNDHHYIYNSVSGPYSLSSEGQWQLAPNKVLTLIQMDYEPKMLGNIAIPNPSPNPESEQLQVINANQIEVNGATWTRFG